MSPALNGSSAIRHFKHSNAIEIHNEITFNFYMGLPRIQRIISCFLTFSTAAETEHYWALVWPSLICCMVLLVMWALWSCDHSLFGHVALRLLMWPLLFGHVTTLSLSVWSCDHSLVMWLHESNIVTGWLFQWGHRVIRSRVGAGTHDSCL